MARKLLLPDHFYLYEEKLPCSGCNGCNDYIPGNVKPFSVNIVRPNNLSNFIFFTSKTRRGVYNMAI